MTKSEIETTITYNMEDAFAIVYTCMPAVMRRIEGKGVEADITFRDQKGSVIAKQYQVPKKWIKISPPRTMSEEQKQAVAIRLHQYRKIDATLPCGVGGKPLEMDCGGVASG